MDKSSFRLIPTFVDFKVINFLNYVDLVILEHLSNKYRFISSEFENIKNSFLFDSLEVNFLKKIRLNFFYNNSFFYNYSFKSVNEDFYITNNFTKNSNTMSQCSRHLRKNSTNF